MTEIELIRRDGRVVEVAENGRTRRLVRDAEGRLIGLEGQSFADELAQRLGAVAARTDDLAARAGEIAARADEAFKRTLTLEGWEQAGDLMISSPGVKAVIRRLGVRWPTVTISWMTTDDAARRDRGSGRPVGGYRRASSHPPYFHVIVIRPGMSARQTEQAIAHELGHCRQAELLGELFDAAYLVDGGVALERQAREAAETVADVELVRPAETRSST